METEESPNGPFADDVSDAPPDLDAVRYRGAKDRMKKTSITKPQKRALELAI